MKFDLSSLPPIGKKDLNLSPEDLAAAEEALKKLEAMVVDDLPSPPTTKQLSTEEKSLEEVSAILPPIVPTRLSEEALEEVDLMADKLVEAFDAKPKEVESEILHTPSIGDEIASEEEVSESNELESTKNALSLVVEGNESELNEVKANLEESSLELAGGNAANIVGTQIDEALEADPELFEKIIQIASGIADKFKSDSAGAKTAFDKLQGIYQIGGNVAAIDEVQEGKDDTALQILKNSLKEISVLEISDERKAQISKTLLTQFSFLGDGQERNETQAAEQALISWAGIEEKNVELKLSNQEKAAIDKGFENALMATDEVSPDVELNKEFGDQKEEVEIQQPTVEENEVEISQPVKEQEEEEEKIETPQPVSEEAEEKKEELEKVEELKEKEVEELEEKEEEEKKKKSATHATESSSVNLPEDEKPKKGISVKQLEEFAKASVKPAIRISIALTCAFLVPGVGPIVALGFLAVTSSKEEEKKDFEKKSKGVVSESEVEKYLKEKVKIADAQDNPNPTTEVGKATNSVEAQEGDKLEQMTKGLEVNATALEGVDEKKFPPSPSSVVQEEDTHSAIKNVAQAISAAGGTTSTDEEKVVVPPVVNAQSNNQPSSRSV